MTESSPADRLQRVLEEVHQAAETAGRPGQVQLVAVSKTVLPDQIFEVYQAGQRVFGENRVQEGTAKIGALSPRMPDMKWHLIGHLQTNKARAAAESFDLIESIDSLKIATTLDRWAHGVGKTVEVLIQVNVAADHAKHGVATERFWDDLQVMEGLHGLSLRGLMTIAPLTAAVEDVRPVFRRLRELRDAVQERCCLASFTELSMGMSRDFQVAIQEGATMVRVGRAIFGERPSNEMPGRP